MPNTEGALSGAASGASLGAAAGPYGAAAGAIVGGFLGGSGGQTHGPGTASRADHESAFVAARQSKTIEENESFLASYLNKHKNCANASDPGSCKRLAGLTQQVIDYQKGLRDGPNDAPSTTSGTPIPTPPATDPRFIPSDALPGLDIVSTGSADSSILPWLLAAGALFYFWRS